MITSKEILINTFFLFSFVIRFYYIKICPIPTKELKESEAKNEKTK